jgi:hypothetical protein
MKSRDAALPCLSATLEEKYQGLKVEAKMRYFDDGAVSRVICFYGDAATIEGYGLAHPCPHRPGEYDDIDETGTRRLGCFYPESAYVIHHCPADDRIETRRSNQNPLSKKRELIVRRALKRAATLNN